MKRLVVESGNTHKVQEVKKILAPMGFHVRSMKEIKKELDIQEDGGSFEENALIKARALSAISREIVLADDSGLEVEALDGAPGIYSARYAGVHGDDQANNDRLLGIGGCRGKRGGKFYAHCRGVSPWGGNRGKWGV